MSMNKSRDDAKFKELCSQRVGRLQCIDRNFDRAGAVTDTLTFKFGDGTDRLMYMSTFYGSSWTLNPGPRHRDFDRNTLTKEEDAYVWECHQASDIFI